MSAVILPFRHPFAVASLNINVRDPSYIQVREFGDRLFVTDRELGDLLGFADPLLALGQLYARHCAELHWRSMLIDLCQAEPCGRVTVRVFDLEGAMRLCELARTPPAVLLYAKLAGRAIAEFAVPSDDLPKAPVVLFPRPRTARSMAKEVSHGSV